MSKAFVNPRTAEGSEVSQEGSGGRGGGDIFMACERLTF